LAVHTTVGRSKPRTANRQSPRGGARERNGRVIAPTCIRDLPHSLGEGPEVR
jgi:hypothetical protein